MRKIITFTFLLMSLLFGVVVNAAVNLPNPGTFSWTYDYWINKKYNQANNSVYSYTNGTYSARDYVDLVIKTIDSTETEKIDATEKLTNLCYLINKNENIDVSDCLSGKLDSNVETFLKYIVSLDYHKEQITMCIDETQSLSTVVSGNSNRVNLLNSNNANSIRKTKVDLCENLGYGVEISPTWYLSTNRMSRDTSVNRADTSETYSLQTVSFSTSNRATNTNIKTNLTTLDCEYLQYKDYSEFIKYCSLSSLVSKINKGIDACADTGRESKNSKGTQSQRHINANEIWGVKIKKRKKSDSWSSWYRWYYEEDPQGREMRKSSPTCSIKTSNGICNTVSCSGNNCYSNITCQNSDQGSSSRVDVKYPNLENKYYVYNTQTNDYVVTNRNISFNSNAINFMKTEGLGDCRNEDIAYFSGTKFKGSSIWFGLNNSNKDTFVKNSLGEYYVDPKIINVSAGKGSTSVNPVVSFSRSTKSVTYCYN